MNRRHMAMQLGGRFLLQAILRHYPEMRYRLRRRLTREEVERYKLAEQKVTKWLNEELPSFMTKEARELSEGEKFLIRDAFYDCVNMTATTLGKWNRDPRVADGAATNPVLRRHANLLAHRQLRELITLRGSARKSGVGWTDHFYDVARKSIFVIQNVFHRYFLDYESWILLRNFGRDWARPIGVWRLRRLPPLVELEAQLALVRYRKPGDLTGAL